MSSNLLQSLHPAERLILVLVMAWGSAGVAAIVLLSRQVNWPPFVIGTTAAILMVAVGSYARAAKGAQRFALSVNGLGLFLAFMPLSTVFIFSLFPLSNPTIDLKLITLDASLGYHWPTFVGALADYPDFAKSLGFVYQSFLPQAALTILLLGALGRATQLHRFMLVGILAMIAAVSIWWLWPSVGPSAFLSISPEVLAATDLVFSPEYGAYLRSLVEVGPPMVSPEYMTGVVAFPSYHMIMACMVVWYTRGTFGFWLAAPLNLLMIPATLSHGGHHLIDLLAGVVVFALCAWVAARVIRPV
jgi:hypothetical protein